MYDKCKLDKIHFSSLTFFSNSSLHFIEIFGILRAYDLFSFQLSSLERIWTLSSEEYTGLQCIWRKCVNQYKAVESEEKDRNSDKKNYLLAASNVLDSIQRCTKCFIPCLALKAHGKEVQAVRNFSILWKWQKSSDAMVAFLTIA